MKKFCRGRGFGQTICLHVVVSHAPKFLSLSLSSSLLVSHHIILIPQTQRETLFKKILDSVSRNRQPTGTVSRNSQQDGALTRLTLQRHKTKGNKNMIQIFSEFDSLHEMGVKAVFWSSWAPIPRFYCLRLLPQPTIPVQLAVTGGAEPIRTAIRSGDHTCTVKPLK